MATVNPLSGSAPASARPYGRLLVLLTSLPQEKLASLLEKLAASIAAEELLIATSDEAAKSMRPDLQFVSAPTSKSSWTVSAEDFASAAQLAQVNNATTVLMLGPECDSLSQSSLRDLASAMAAPSVDLGVPRYDLPSRAGLLNSAILYPLSRALFASPVRFPLAVDLGLSGRMVEHLSVAAQRLMRVNQGGAFLWPASEAAAAGFTIREVDVGSRAVPGPRSRT